jgi:hypothetical protein
MEQGSSAKRHLWLSALGTTFAPFIITVTGITGFWPTLAVCMAGLVWSLFVFRDELSRLRIVPKDGSRSSYGSPLSLLPGIASLFFIAFPFVRLYETLRFQGEPLGFEDVLQSYMHDKTIYIADLARIESTVHDKVFERVTFIGPAIIALISDNNLIETTIDGGGADFDALVLPVPQGTRTVGAIGFRNCVLKHCNFFRIQLMGTKEDIDKFKRSIVVINGTPTRSGQAQ